MDMFFGAYLSEELGKKKTFKERESHLAVMILVIQK